MGEMKGGGDVRNLEANMTDGSRMKGVQRQRDCADLEAKMRRDFEEEATKMEEGYNERRKVYDEQEEIKSTKMGSNCTVSSAASTEFGVASGTFGTKLERQLGAEGNLDQRVGDRMVDERNHWSQ